VSQPQKGRGPTIRLTDPTKAVLRTLIRSQSADNQAEMFGLAIHRETGLGPGTVYPILRRLERAGWLEAREEAHDEAPHDARPPRIYYRIKPGSLRAVQRKVAEHDARYSAELVPSNGRLKPAKGVSW